MEELQTTPERLKAVLYTLSRRITDPSSKIQSPAEAYRARLTTSLILVLMAFVVFAIGVSWRQDSGTPAILIGALVCLTVAYGLSRTRYFVLSAWLLIVSLISFSFIVSVSLTDSDVSQMRSNIHLAAIPVAFWLAYLLLSSVGLATTMTIGAAAILALTVLEPAQDFTKFTALAFIIVILMAIAAWQRDGYQRQIAISEAQYRKLFDEAPFGIYRTAKDGQFIEVNAAYARMFGYDSPDELITLVRNTQELHVDHNGRAKLHELSHKNGSYNGHEIQCYRKDGSVFWISISGRVIRDANGNPAVYEGMVEDITARKEAEEARRQSEEKYQTLFNEAAFGIFRSTPEGKLVDANPRLLRAMGFETLEDYHAQWTTIGDSHVDPQLRPKFQHVMEEDGVVEDFESEVKCKDGTTMWFSEYSRAVYDDDGKIVAYEGTMVDVTERKRLERERIDMIRERERAKVETLRRFTGEAAHDLLTPLTTMITSLYLLRRTTSDQGQLKRIETLERHTGHIHQSVNALLKMTRLNRSTFDIQAVALNALVADVIAQQQSLAEGKHIALNFEPDQVVNHVMIDREEMAFALRQVIANAMAYSENGQTISIRTAMRDSQAVIIVIDQGRGIKPDDLPFVFEPFFRSQERDTSKGGVGLGLTIAQWIVNAHGGQIAVQSEVGAGSTVTISLPLISAEV